MVKDRINKLGFQVFEDRLINPSQLGISSRQINYWIHNTVVPFVNLQEPAASNIVEEHVDSTNESKQKWVRLNLAQAVWISIVKQLFQFKVPLVTVQELAEKVWNRPRVEKYADRVFEYHITSNPHNLDETDLNRLANHLKDEPLMEYHFRTFMNPFTEMVKDALFRNSIPYSMLYVPDSNDYEFYYGDKSLITNLSSAYVQEPMIVLPIAPIIAKVLQVDFFNRKSKSLDYLTDVERQIRDVVVFKRPKSVQIAFGKHGPDLITITEKHKSREQLAEYILFNKIRKGSKLVVDVRSNGNYKIDLIKKNNLKKH